MLIEILLYSFSSILYCWVAFLSEIRSIKLRVDVSNIRPNNPSNCFCFSDHARCFSESVSSGESPVKIFHKPIILR
jgi:hypothetical protein